MNRIDRSWIENTFDLPDGREATVYIHPRAAVKFTYAPVIPKCERLHAKLWEMINNYVNAEVAFDKMDDDYSNSDQQEAVDVLRTCKKELQECVDEVIEEIRVPPPAANIKEKLIALRDEMATVASQAKEQSKHWLAKGTMEGDRFSWQLEGSANAFALCSHHLHQLICKAGL
jgi:hypothetical protein